MGMFGSNSLFLPVTMPLARQICGCSTKGRCRPLPFDLGLRRVTEGRKWAEADHFILCQFQALATGYLGCFACHLVPLSSSWSEEAERHRKQWGTNLYLTFSLVLLIDAFPSSAKPGQDQNPQPTHRCTHKNRCLLLSVTEMCVCLLSDNS